MKHLKLFEHYAVPSELEIAAKKLGATIVAEYYVLDIDDMPKSFENNVIVYVPYDKTYRVYERDYNKNKEASDIVSLKKAIYRNEACIEENSFQTESAEQMLNIISLHRFKEKGLSDEVFMWLEEEIMEVDTLKKAIKNLVQSIEISKKDCEILGLDYQGIRGQQTGIKFGV